jgi:hypothetical protein
MFCPLRPHRPSRRTISRRMFAKSAVREDGQSLVFCAVLLTVLLGLTALTVDLGSLYVAQNTSDCPSSLTADFANILREMVRREGR